MNHMNMVTLYGQMLEDLAEPCDDLNPETIYLRWEQEVYEETGSYPEIKKLTVKQTVTIKRNKQEN